MLLPGQPSPGWLLVRGYERAAFVSAASDEISGGVHSADLAALQIAVQHSLAVLSPICARAQLDVVLLNLLVNRLLTLPIRWRIRIGRRDRREHEGGGTRKRCQTESGTVTHGENRTPFPQFDVLCKL